MKTNAAKVARQYRIQQWADQIRDCNNRPKESSVKDWCDEHNITTANYYYRLKEVRKACLATLPAEQEMQQVIPISTELASMPVSDEPSFLEIVTDNVTIRVNQDTSPELLRMVLQVTANVE